MRDDFFLPALRQQLAVRGCPRPAARRILREAAEHLEDLEAAARGAGRPNPAADAAGQLGDPAMLAERHVSALRHASWWGRHPLVGLGLLPLVAGPVLWMALLGAGMVGGAWLVILLGFGGSSSAFSFAAGHPAVFPWLWVGTRMIDVAALVLVIQLFCWRARRAALDRRWLLPVGAVLSLQGLWLVARLQPHEVSILFALPRGLLGQFDWARASIPLLITALHWTGARRAVDPSASGSARSGEAAGGTTLSLNEN